MNVYGLLTVSVNGILITSLRSKVMNNLRRVVKEYFPFHAKILQSYDDNKLICIMCQKESEIQ